MTAFMFHEDDVRQAQRLFAPSVETNPRKSAVMPSVKPQRRSGCLVAFVLKSSSRRHDLHLIWILVSLVSGMRSPVRKFEIELQYTLLQYTLSDGISSTALKSILPSMVRSITLDSW